MPAIDPETELALIRDLLEAQADVVSIAQRHGMTVEALAAWADRPGVRRALLGMCRLADLQAQLLVSRYRLVAVTRLIGQATQSGDAGDGVNAEGARRACADLLKAELVDDTASGGGEEADEEEAAWGELRAALDRDEG